MHDLIRPLTEVSLRLTFIYAAAVTAALALRAQNSGQDADVADCLRMGVCDPVDDQARRLKAIIERLGDGFPAVPEPTAPERNS